MQARTCTSLFSDMCIAEGLKFDQEGRNLEVIILGTCDPVTGSVLIRGWVEV